MSQFQAHLDECARCREHPFDLCKRGEELLVRAGMEVVKQVFATAARPTQETDAT